MKNFKNDFQIFKKNKSLVYLDSAATSQKPKVVTDAISDFYETYNANVHRGLYPISEKATEKVEKAREKVAKFINAKESSEIIFVKNTTEAINLVAYSTSQNIKRGDGIVTTIMEHHSNFVPWQILTQKSGAKLKVIDVDDAYKLKIKNEKLKITIKNSKLLAITQVSNVLGIINPIKEIIRKARLINPGIKIIVDAAQSVPHIKVDVQELDCDFLAFSGHKMLAATGIGVLYGKKVLLEKMEPFMFGGGMIKSVDIKETIFADLPYKFEAGTPDISGIISLGAAIDYLEKVGLDNIQKHEQKLTAYCLERMEGIKGLTVYGVNNHRYTCIPVAERAGIISFNINGVHAHDVAQILGNMGICVRAGHHCAMPLHQKLGVPATVRASFYLYNNKKDIEKLIDGIKKVQAVFNV